MVTKRIIPCLDVRNGRVVKGTNFEGIKDVADPVEMARLYNAAGADELVFYDITASFEGRALFTDILTQVASEIFIPLTVGGGINTLEDFDRVLKCGGRQGQRQLRRSQEPGPHPGGGPALRRPVRRPLGGRQAGERPVPGLCQRRAGGHRPRCAGLDRVVHRARRGGGLPEQHRHRRRAERFRPRNAGRCGGAGPCAHHRQRRRGQKGGFFELFHHKGIDAGLAAGIFHQKLLSISDLKAYLNENGIEMRV